MTALKKHDVKADTIHRDPAFGKPDMSVFISTAVFAALGTFVGHYVGRFGEMNVKLGYRGLSTLLGTVGGGVLFGGVAGYSAMLERGKEKLEADEVSASGEKDFTASLAEHAPKTYTQHVEHQGSVQTAAFDKAI